MKLTAAQKVMVSALKAGGSLKLSKRAWSYGKHTLNGAPASSVTVSKLQQYGLITVDQSDNLEASYKLTAKGATL